MESSTGKGKSFSSAFIAITALFFMWGFMTVLNDILVPYLKGVFELSYFEAMLVQFAFFGAYFVGSLIYFIISVSSGDPINRIGYKNGIVIGLMVSAIGAGLFYPAAELVSFAFFLSALFVLGLGFTLLQIAANPYVAVLGSEKTASSRLSLSQGFNSLGTAIAPALGGYLILEYFVGSGSGADAVKTPYILFACIFVLLAFFIKAINLPKFTNDAVIKKGSRALKYRQLSLGMIAIFMYVGGEVSIGSMLISFLGIESIAGLNESQASAFVSFYWGGLMIGRFIGSISMSKMKLGSKSVLIASLLLLSFSTVYYLQGQDIALKYGALLLMNLIAFSIGRGAAARTLAIFAISVSVLLATAIVADGQAAMWCMLGIGLFNSIMWPNIFTLAIKGLGSHTGQGSSLLVMMIAGGAIFPLAQGAAADAFGVQASFAVPIAAFLYLAYYGISGYKPHKAESLQHSAS